MKVLHLINTLSTGGAELQLLTLCRHLKHQGVELVVVYLREQVQGTRSLRSDFEQEGIRVVSLHADNRYDWRFLSKLARLLRVERPHILHSHLPRADIAAALLHRFMRSPAFFCSVHGIYQDQWFGPWIAPLLRQAYREADGVIAISYAVKSWLCQGLGISADKITVVHYGIEPERFAHPKQNLVTAWRLEGQAIIGSIGRLEVGKGFDCLIQAMSVVQRHVPRALLMIAGHNPSGYGQALRTLIDRLQLNDRVKLVGFQDDIPSFLHALEVFAFASRSEGFGQVVIEAMAAGKPVVASKIPSLIEIVIGGETGFLVDPNDSKAFAHALVWLLNHLEEAKEIGKRGRERLSQQFSVEKMGEKTLSLYWTLVEAGH